VEQGQRIGKLTFSVRHRLQRELAVDNHDVSSGGVAGGQKSLGPEPRKKKGIAGEKTLREKIKGHCSIS